VGYLEDKYTRLLISENKHHHRKTITIWEILLILPISGTFPCPIFVLWMFEPKSELEMTTNNRVMKLSAHLVTEECASVSKLVGRCYCGGVSWEGIGEPAVTFYCHCSLCRRAGGAAFVGAAAFKPENVVFHGEANIKEFLPAGSKVPRRYCKKCNSYIAEDARSVLGVFALPIGLCQDKVPEIYTPKQHIFYDSRIVDVSDTLPKYMQMPDGPRAE